METGITRNQILSQLSKSPHGKLTEYLTLGQQAFKQEPEFSAHLISWDRAKGQIRDAKVALPVVSLTVPEFCRHSELRENSLAHLALLGPRELLRALRFTFELPAARRQLRLLAQRYLRDLEADRRAWNRSAVQHRRTLKELYALSHTKPSGDADAILFKGFRPAGSVFEVISRLGKMSPQEAASEIITRKIPFLIAKGALGEKAKDPDLVLALINSMSATELVTSTKMLEKLGMKSNPALRGAFESALEKAATSSKNVLKTTRAAEAMEDEGLRQKLQGLQEKQISKMAGIEGDWLVLGDKSPSMNLAIEAARQVAATLARFVRGKVHLIFFDSMPRYFDATGLTYDEILKGTKYVVEGDGTSIGCGVQYILDKKIPVDGIAVVSDGQENSAPWFFDRYKKLCGELEKDIPVYLYRFAGTMHNLRLDKDLADTMRAAGLQMQEFDLRKGVDFYSLPNLVETMRVQRYGLLEEILDTKLLSLADVFKHERTEHGKEKVHA